MGDSIRVLKINIYPTCSVVKAYVPTVEIVSRLIMPVILNVVNCKKRVHGQAKHYAKDAAESD